MRSTSTDAVAAPPRAARAAAPTAPPGYKSNYQAVIDVLRFAPSIWKPTTLTVLLFHVERSLFARSYGRGADQHSAGQAENGVYSRRGAYWVRGPAGVSRAAWHRANGELLATYTYADGAVQHINPAGVLHGYERTSWRGDKAPTEYVLDWTALRSAIISRQAALSADAGPLFAVPPEPAGEPAPRARRRNPAAPPGLLFDLAAVGKPEPALPPSGGLSQPETTPVSRGDNRRLRLRQPSSQPETTYSESETAVALSCACTVSAGRAAPPPPAPDHPPTPMSVSIEHVRYALEHALRRQITRRDPLPAELASLAEKLELPLHALEGWIHAKAEEKRAKGYPMTPGLFRTIAATDLPGWAAENAHRIAEAERRARERRLCTMPPRASMPPRQACPNCGETAAYPVGSVLWCASPQCDPKGLTWHALERWFAEHPYAEGEEDACPPTAASAT